MKKFMSNFCSGGQGYSEVYVKSQDGIVQCLRALALRVIKPGFQSQFRSCMKAKPLKHRGDNVYFYGHYEDYLGRLRKVVHTEPGTY